MQIRIQVPVKPTENVSKVKASVLNVFPDATFTDSEDHLVAEAKSLEKLREMFRTQNIRDTARKILRASRDELTIRFSLNKQAAFVGRANFAPPSPMGPIDVTIEDEDIDAVINFLTRKPEFRIATGQSSPHD